MPINVALQTIAWENIPLPLDALLSEAAAAGYRGIEFGHRSPIDMPVEEVISLLDEHALQLVGVACGSIETRVQIASAYAHAAVSDAPPYIYSDCWNPELNKRFVTACKDLDCDGMLKVAIHPHMYKDVQTQRDVDHLLSQFPSLSVLPDTGHLTVAGIDSIDFIDRYWDRIPAVHLKDWTPRAGESLPFFSQGFTDLGCGAAKLDRVVRHLQQRSFSGWVVVEIDHCIGSDHAASRSHQWLVDTWSE